MKNHYVLFSFLILTAFSFGQNREVFNKNYDPIRQELKNWDAVRGDWLASSLESMAFSEQIPDRPFPENFTPHQMMRMVPAETRNNLTSLSNQRNPEPANSEVWDRLNRYTRTSQCTPALARSYGDPHLVSFDGARFSFQTVGEFVMTKAPSQNMELQVRQRAQGDDFSLNSAVAMNVGGDRLCIYSRDYPDADYSTPIRLNGMSLLVQGSTYFLPHGGTLRKSGNIYTVDFPSGEVVIAEIKGSGRSAFMNVSIQVSPCDVMDYSGLLGNANGTQSDDFNIRGRSPAFGIFGSNDDKYVKKERQAYLAKEFADEHRITQMTSLFDYPIGHSTLSYTDRSFPRVYRDLNDLSTAQRERSRKLCQSRGVSNSDMSGCVYDNAYLALDPVRKPVVADPTEGTVLREVRSHTPLNVNPNRPTPPKPNPRPAKEVRSQLPQISNPGAQPIPTNDSGDIKNRETIKKPSSTTPSKPVYKPKPVTKPKPVYKPRPTPRPTTRPIPKPKPVFKPRPAPRPTTRPTPKPKPVFKPKPKPSSSRGGR